MKTLRLILLLLVLFQGAWLTFDGSRALIVGDYVTPPNGQLGPWSHIVSAVRLEPRSTVVKSLICCLGILWLVAFISLVTRVDFAKRFVLVCAIATLWYLPLGTAASVAVILLIAAEGIVSANERAK